MLVNFAEWAPDVADLNSAYTSEVQNVFCASASYIPAFDHLPFTEALPATPLGAFFARSLDGSIAGFAGTTDKLWRLNNTSLEWDDVSQALTSYNASTTTPWCFAQFGEFVIAVNENDDPQVLQLGVDTTFRDLGGNPPRAGIVKVWGDFVALMRLTDNLNRVQWSGLNDCEEWTPGTANSDYQDFGDGGVVQGSTEATNPLIFLEKAIIRCTFVPGSVEVFTFQKIHDQRGAKSAKSIASRGAASFFVDEGGFFQIGSDGSLAPIGFEKVDRSILSRLQGPDIADIQGVVDPFYTRVYWLIDFSGNGFYDAMLVYDWNLKRWSQVQQQISTAIPAATIGYTLEGLDAISASLDDLPYSLDSRAWQGGTPILAAFSLDNRLGFFTGDAKEAVVVTQEMGDVAGGVVRTTNTYCVVDTDEVFVSIGFRFRRSDTLTWLSEQRPSANTGRIRKLSRSRFHRFKMRIPAGAVWNHAQAIDVSTQPAGTR